MRLEFDHLPGLLFRGSVVTCSAGLLAYRALDDALGGSELADKRLADTRAGKNRQHAPIGMLRQVVFGWLAGYEDADDAGRLRYDSAMSGCAASPSQTGHFETRKISAEKNLSALADLSGQWIDRVQACRPPRGLVLDMGSSVSPTYDGQENSTWHVIRLPANRVLHNGIGRLLQRPVGNPSLDVRRSYANVTYQAANRAKPRRAVAKVERHPGELYPRIGFIVADMASPAENIVAFSNKRGICEPWMREVEAQSKWTRLSCGSSAGNAPHLRLHALASNLDDFSGTSVTPEPVKDWSLTTPKERPLGIAAEVVAHARYVTFQMAEVAASKNLPANTLRMIAEPRPPLVASSASRSSALSVHAMLRERCVSVKEHPSVVRRQGSSSLPPLTWRPIGHRLVLTESRIPVPWGRRRRGARRMSDRKVQHSVSKPLYALLSRSECCAGHLKEPRRVATG